MCVCVCVCVYALQGLDADVRQRLSTWRLQVKNIDLHLDRQELEDGELHDALRNALQQLGTLHDPPPVYIRYKQEVKPALPWTPELLRVLAEAPRNIPSVKAAVRVDGPLTDELLTSVLHNGRHVHSLSVASVSLQSDTYANTPWPWEEFTCDTVDVSQPVIWQIVTKQPNLSAVRDVTEHTTEIVIPADVTGVSVHMHHCLHAPPSHPATLCSWSHPPCAVIDD